MSCSDAFRALALVALLVPTMGAGDAQAGTRRADSDDFWGNLARPGHKRFVAPEFAVKMMEALMAHKLVPLEGAKEKGLLKKRYCCPGCGQELAADAQGRVEAKRVLEMQGLDAFGVQVDLPKYRCAACGRESVEPRDALVDDLMKASVHAFRAAEVAPT